MFNMNHGGDKNVADGLNNNLSLFSILLDFHHHVNTVIAMVRPKDVMVYARGINHEQDNITSIIGMDLIWR